MKKERKGEFEQRAATTELLCAAAPQPTSRSSLIKFCDTHWKNIPNKRGNYSKV
jgi:hypothetical protein